MPTAAVLVQPKVGYTVLAATPVAFTIVVLVFMIGGRSAGWLAAAEVGTFASVAVLAATGRIAPHRAARGVIWALAAAGVAGMVSTAFSRQPANSVPALLEWLWLGGEALLVANVSQRRQGREALVCLLVAAVFAQAFWSFFVWWGGQDATRAQVGTFYAPNQYAGYVLLVSPLLLALCLTSASRLVVAGSGVAAAYLYLAIALSGSRAGAGAAGVGALAVLGVAARRRAGRAMLRAGLVAAALLGLGALMTSPLLFASPHSSGGLGGVIGRKGADTTDLTQRLDWDLAALEMGAQRPLVGTGLGTYGAMFFKIQQPAWQWSKWAHNQYLEGFAEGGVPLLAALLALPLVALSGGFRGLRGGVADNDFWRLGLWAGLLGGSAHLLVDHDWSYPAYAAAFVAVAVLVVAPWEAAAAIPDAAAPPRWCGSTRLAVTGLAVLCGLAVIGQSASNRLLGAGPGDRARLRFAAALAPTSAGPFEALGLVQVAEGGSGNLSDAARSFRSAIVRNQLDPTLRWELAGVENELGNLAAARGAFRSAIQVAPLAASVYLEAADFETRSAHDPGLGLSILCEGIGRLRRVPAAGGQGGGLADLLRAAAQAGGTAGC